MFVTGLAGEEHPVCSSEGAMQAKFFRRTGLSWRTLSRSSFHQLSSNKG